MKWMKWVIIGIIVAALAYFGWAFFALYAYHNWGWTWIL